MESTKIFKTLYLRLLMKGQKLSRGKLDLQNQRISIYRFCRLSIALLQWTHELSLPDLLSRPTCKRSYQYKQAEKQAYLSARPARATTYAQLLQVSLQPFIARQILFNNVLLQSCKWAGDETHRSRHTQRVLLRLGLTTAELKLSKVMGPVKSAAARPPHILDQSTDPVPRYPLWLSPTWKYLLTESQIRLVRKQFCLFCAWPRMTCSDLKVHHVTTILTEQASLHRDCSRASEISFLNWCNVILRRWMSWGQW